MIEAENDKFILMGAWTIKLRGDLKSFQRTTYFGPPLFALINVMFCFALQKGNHISFWILYIPITILSTIFCLLVPRRAISRYINIVQSFEFNSNHEMLVTVIDGKTLKISNPDIKDGFFDVDKVEKPCKLIIDDSNKLTLTVIPEFFTNPPLFN